MLVWPDISCYLQLPSPRALPIFHPLSFFQPPPQFHIWGKIQTQYQLLPFFQVRIPIFFVLKKIPVKGVTKYQQSKSSSKLDLQNNIQGKKYQEVSGIPSCLQILKWRSVSEWPRVGGVVARQLKRVVYSWQGS